MKILVANFGSTSFKYRLFDMAGIGETMLAKGGYERVTDYNEVVDDCLGKLVSEGAIGSLDELDAVGFKTVMGRNLSGCVCDDEAVLEALDGFASLAPAHNPPYANGIRTFGQRIPNVPRVALFETAFYQWVPEAARVYAVPNAWREAGLERYGFHGASHKFVAERSAELLQRDDVAERVRGLYVDGPGDFSGAPLRVISCHLGGSSSVTGVNTGVAIGTSMGFTPQSGLPQNNRVGELDSGAVPFIMNQFQLSIEEVQTAMTTQSGLFGLSGGAGNDMRDLWKAKTEGNSDAGLAIDHLVYSIRKYLGQYHLEMNGLEALVFTAGIGERDPDVREAVCANLSCLGLKLDLEKNKQVGVECEIQSDDSAVKILVIPTNEELIVARETKRLLQAQQTNA
ncbi:MAG: acetate kinase [Candidatus Omnitrophota bacterium]|jgi:acetate kinase